MDPRRLQTNWIRVPGKLVWAECDVVTPRGRMHVEWHLNATSHFRAL